MKIRKKEQSVGILGKILNLKNNSKTDTYSANYLNDRLVKVSPTEPETGEEVWIQKSKNLFNPDKHIISDGTFYSWENGSLATHADYYGVKIPVSPNTTYVSSSNLEPGYWSSLCYWDKDMNWILGDAYNSNFKVITTPSNCAYITFALMKTYKWFQFELGDTITEYEAYDRRIHVKNSDGNYEEFIKPQIKASLYVPTTGEEVWIQKGKNLIDINTLVEGYINGDDGSFVTWSDQGEMRSDYIKVSPNTTYTFTILETSSTFENWIAVGEYTNSKGFIQRPSTNSAQYTFTTSSTTEYIIVCARNLANATQITLEQGNKLLRKIHTKNDNGVYEEFYSEEANLDIYSTSEQRIGTWIDGKPLYRKVIEFPNGLGAASGVTGNNFQLNEMGINNVEEIFVVHPSFYTLNNRRYPFAYNDGSYYDVSVEPSRLNIKITYEDIAKSRIVVTLEYTKTTD